MIGLELRDLGPYDGVDVRWCGSRPLSWKDAALPVRTPEPIASVYVSLTAIADEGAVPAHLIFHIDPAQRAALALRVAARILRRCQPEPAQEPTPDTPPALPMPLHPLHASTCEAIGRALYADTCTALGIGHGALHAALFGGGTGVTVSTELEVADIAKAMHAIEQSALTMHAGDNYVKPSDSFDAAVEAADPYEREAIAERRAIVREAVRAWRLDHARRTAAVLALLPAARLVDDAAVTRTERPPPAGASAPHPA